MNASNMLESLEHDSLRLSSATHLVRLDDALVATTRSYLELEGTPGGFRFLAELLTEMADSVDRSAQSEELQGAAPPSTSAIMDPVDTPQLRADEWSAVGVRCVPRAEMLREFHSRVVILSRQPDADGRDRLTVEVQNQHASALRLTGFRYETDGAFSGGPLDREIEAGGRERFDLTVFDDTREIALWLDGHALTPGVTRSRCVGFRSMHQPMPQRTS